MGFDTPSINTWKYALPPNYNQNIDKIYPYSETPYLGEYNLVKLPLSLNNLIEHIDYWGEGRIYEYNLISGFTDCYNINHAYQLVSNGADRDRKIPNRIPIVNYTNCDTSSYVKDNSVKLVTLMGAPINSSCAKDIGRIINSDVGKVVVFGFNDNTADIKNLESQLKNKNLFLCADYVLPPKLQEITLFDNYKAYLNLTDIQDILYKNIKNAQYYKAVTISKVLHNNNKGDTLVDIVKKLLKEGNKNIMSYAYQLCNNDAREIVLNYFNESFSSIFNETYMTIINKHYNLAIKLDSNVNPVNDRLAWGDSTDKNSHRVIWKFVPIWDINNYATFKIVNIEHGMFLKLDVHTDEYGDRKTWGSHSSTENRFKWYLEPIMVNNDILFYIINNEYNQGLKLDAHVDQYNDRIVWGNNGPVHGNPDYFGWYLQKW